MTFDPNISAGTVIAALSICLTIIISVTGAYIGVTRHMTTNEQQIAALLQRMAKVELKQEKHDEKLSALQTLIAGLEAKLESFLQLVGRRLSVGDKD